MVFCPLKTIRSPEVIKNLGENTNSEFGVFPVTTA
jgi:hypothetical protein